MCEKMLFGVIEKTKSLLKRHAKDVMALHSNYRNDIMFGFVIKTIVY